METLGFLHFHAKHDMRRRGGTGVDVQHGNVILESLLPVELFPVVSTLGEVL